MTTKLANILETIETGVGRAVKTCGYMALWAEIVDEKVRQNTEAVRINNQILFVATSAPVWSQELSYFKDDLVAKFNQKAGREVIKEIKFKSA